MSSALRLAAILSAGVEAKTALNQLGENEINPELLGVLAKAREFGAPLLVVCKQFDAIERSTAIFELEISQAQAVPLATRKLMLWLPALSLVIGQLVGMNPLSALGHPLGILSTVLAAALIWAGSSWSAILLKPLSEPLGHPGKDLMLFRMALDSGLGLSESLSRAGSPEAISQVIGLSRSTGAPLSALLESEIASMAAEQASAAISRARQLSIKLLIPLALTLLPAFLILTLFPMIIGITNR